MPLARLLAAVTLLFAGPLCLATEYTAGFGMEVDTSHDDNIRLVQNNKTAVNKYSAAPTLTLTANNETNQIKLDSTFDFNRYDKNEFNSNDQNVSLTLSRQFENSSFDLSTDYIRNSTITSELLTTGRIGNKAERAERYQISPRWLYNLNETNLLQLQASYTAQNYHSDAYTEYGNTEAQIAWFYKINERLSWIASAAYSDYESDDIVFGVPRTTFFLPAGYFGQQSYSVRTKTTGLNFGLNYEWSEQSSIDARLGRSKIRTDYPTNDPNNICVNPEFLSFSELIREQIFGAICNSLPSSNSFASTADITWSWKSERQQISLTGTKATQPTSNGYTVDAIQIGSSWGYQLTELDRLGVSLTVVRNRAIDDKSILQNASNADRDYESGSLSYQRQISEYWFLRASYQFSKQKYTEIDYEANSNVVAVSINYRPQLWYWSR